VLSLQAQNHLLFSIFDFRVPGRFAFQVVEKVAAASEVLKAARIRERPWRA
jgi:hypothetical protein